VIAHTLQFATEYIQMIQPPTDLNGLGWPVYLADFFCAAGNNIGTGSPTDCVGNLQWGAMIGIPTVAQGGPNCSSLGLTTHGVMLVSPSKTTEESSSAMPAPPKRR